MSGGSCTDRWQKGANGAVVIGALLVRGGFLLVTALEMPPISIAVPAPTSNSGVGFVEFETTLQTVDEAGSDHRCRAACSRASASSNGAQGRAVLGFCSEHGGESLEADRWRASPAQTTLKVGRRFR